jgi:hypothetical protein
MWAIRAVIKERDFPIHSKSTDPGLYTEYWRQESAAILYTLLNRWHKYSDLFPTFESMIRSYCTGLRKPLTDRHHWVHELDELGTKPAHWPTNEYWQPYKQSLLKTVIPTVDEWVQGEIEDPYHGKSFHFGSHQDPILKYRLKQLTGFKNIYYKDQ